VLLVQRCLLTHIFLIRKNSFFKKLALKKAASIPIKSEFGISQINYDGEKSNYWY
jgi:hypothetical protein